ncbi:unnamed protein product [Boreogadus saida]
MTTTALVGTLDVTAPSPELSLRCFGLCFGGKPPVPDILFQHRGRRSGYLPRHGFVWWQGQGRAAFTNATPGCSELREVMRSVLPQSLRRPSALPLQSWKLELGGTQGTLGSSLIGSSGQKVDVCCEKAVSVTDELPAACASLVWSFGGMLFSCSMCCRRMKCCSLAYRSHMKRQLVCLRLNKLLAALTESPANGQEYGCSNRHACAIVPQLD